MHNFAAMKKKLLFLLLFLAGTMPSLAQQTESRRLVVVDIETLIPIGGVNVVSKDKTQTTDSAGYVSIPDSCKSLSFSHVNYESRLINLKDIVGLLFGRRIGVRLADKSEIVGGVILIGIGVEIFIKGVFFG